MIEASLNDYDEKICDYNNKVNSYQKVSDYLKVENNNLAKSFYVFDLDKKCDLCFLNIFTDVFYTFNCSHSFHKNCIETKLVEFGERERIEKIRRFEETLQMGIAKYGVFVANSCLKRRIS